MRERADVNTRTHTRCVSLLVCVTFLLTGRSGLEQRRLHRHLELSPLVEATVVVVEVAGVLALVCQLRVQDGTAWTNNNTFSMKSIQINLLSLLCLRL